MLIESARELVKHRRVHFGIEFPKDERVACVRAKMIESAGSNGTADATQLSIYCFHCQAHKIEPALHALSMKGDEYKDVFEMIIFAAELSSGLVSKTPRKCRKCSNDMMVFIDYHHYNPERRLDLVHRFFLAEPNDTALSYCVLWMDQKTNLRMVSENEVPDAGKVVFYDMTSKALKGLQNNDLDSCATHTKFLMHHFPTAKELVTIAYKLIDTNKRGISEAIGQQLIEYNPDSVEGYALLAQVLLRAYTDSAGLIDGLLDEASQYCQMALERDPHHAATLLAYCNCLRLKNEDASRVTTAFLDLIARYPTYAAAYYNYGLHCMVHHPHQAAAVFAKGYELAPDDGDFLVKQAMALSKVGAIGEAQKVLLKAKNLVPAHPQLSALIPPSVRMH